MKLRTGLVLALILVLGATRYFLIRSAEHRVTGNMLPRVERFAIPSDWQVEDEVARPERFLCLSTNPCPSFYRRWNTGKELNPGRTIHQDTANLALVSDTARPERMTASTSWSAACSWSGHGAESAAWIQ